MGKCVQRVKNPGNWAIKGVDNLGPVGVSFNELSFCPQVCEYKQPSQQILMIRRVG